MNTIRNLCGLLWSWLFLLSFLACDYYEPLEIPIEEELSLDTQGNSSNQISDAAPEKITLYTVAEEEIVKIKDYAVKGASLQFQKDTTKHQEIWQLVKRIIPPAFRSKMSELLIYNGANTNTSGFVDPTINNLSQWQLAIAIDYAYRKPFNTDGEVAFTIIHEFGHILTLNDEQISAGIIEKNCDGYYVSNGCAKDNAYIQMFHDNYWQDILEEHANLENTPEANSLFYAKYKDRFVSRYAANSLTEDIAEVFATFVTEPEMRSGTSITDQKIQMLYQFSELHYIRDYIRQHALTSKGQGVAPNLNGENSFVCATRF